MHKAYQSSFNIEKYFIFLKTTQLRQEKMAFSAKSGNCGSLRIKC